MAERSAQFTVHPLRQRSEASGSQFAEKRPILGYDPLFDISDRKSLDLQKNHLTPAEFQRHKNQLDLRTRHNLETALGERFKVEISQIIYQIVDGLLQNLEHDESFIEIVKRGQRYRQSNGSNETERELAEVEGFARIEEILTEPRFEDAKVIVISPRGQEGSIYQHNFFDVWEKDGDRVTMRRYTSSATYEQSRVAAEFLDPFNNLPGNPTDADFLKTPLITYKQIDEILALFPPDEGVITRQELANIIAICSQLIENYINNPSSKTFTALLNFADALTFTPEVKSPYTSRVRMRITPMTVKRLIDFYGSQPARQVATGCGLQLGFRSTVSGQWSVVNFSPFSVSEFGIAGALEDQYGTLEIHCEECGANYLRTPGKLEKSCRFCGGKHGIVC